MEEEMIETTEEVTLTDLDAINEQKQILPIAHGVRVKIEKPSVRKTLSIGGKDAPQEGENNPVAYKRLNMNLRIVDGISVTDSDGSEKLLYKNKVLFPGNIDFVFWHNPEVKTTSWWANKQYIFSFKALCKALGIDVKTIKINDEFLENLKDKEFLIDIAHEEEQENKGGEWVGKGTFKEKIKNIRAWA